MAMLTLDPAGVHSEHCAFISTEFVQGEATDDIGEGLVLITGEARSPTVSV